jgi:D-alanyl-D-alanine carboxypeptidase
MTTTPDLVALARRTLVTEGYSHDDVKLLAQGYLDAVVTIHEWCSVYAKACAERDAAIAERDAARAEIARLHGQLNESD